MTMRASTAIFAFFAGAILIAFLLGAAGLSLLLGGFLLFLIIVRLLGSAARSARESAQVQSRKEIPNPTGDVDKK
jgi:hypothetical protein